MMHVLINETIKGIISEVASSREALESKDLGFSISKMKQNV